MPKRDRRLKEEIKQCKETNRSLNDFFRISSQIGPSQIGPNSNRPQVKSAPSQIGLKMKVISAQKN